MQSLHSSNVWNCLTPSHTDIKMELLYQPRHKYFLLQKTIYRWRQRYVSLVSLTHDEMLMIKHNKVHILAYIDPPINGLNVYTAAQRQGCFRAVTICAYCGTDTKSGISLLTSPAVKCY